MNDFITMIQTEQKQLTAYEVSILGQAVAGINKIVSNLINDMGLPDDDPRRINILQLIGQINLNSMPESTAKMMMSGMNMLKQMPDEEYFQMGHDFNCMVVKEVLDGNAAESEILQYNAHVIMQHDKTQWSLKNVMEQFFNELNALYADFDETDYSHLSTDERFELIGGMLCAHRLMLEKMSEADEVPSSDIQDMKNHLNAMKDMLRKMISPEMPNVSDMALTHGLSQSVCADPEGELEITMKMFRGCVAYKACYDYEASQQ